MRTDIEVTDALIIHAVMESARLRKTQNIMWPDTWLSSHTGRPPAYCLLMLRGAVARGLLHCSLPGCSRMLRTARPTAEGRRLIEDDLK